MDVKEVLKVIPEEKKELREVIHTSNPFPSSSQIKSIEDSAVKVDAQASNSVSRTRKAANEIVNTINLVVDATGEIDRLVKSINGIVEQANKGDVPEKRLVVLEKEANQLLDAIKRRVQTTKTSHGNPLNGDPIRLEVEQEIGKTLDVILPDHASDSFGIEKIDFSRRDAIIDAKTTIAKAQKRLDDLKSKVNESKDTVHNTVAKLEVALQNSEASSVSVRDLDEALRLAGDTKFAIGKNPNSALDSLGSLNRKALELLEDNR